MSSASASRLLLRAGHLSQHRAGPALAPSLALRRALLTQRPAAAAALTFEPQRHAARFASTSTDTSSPSSSADDAAFLSSSRGAGSAASRAGTAAAHKDRSTESASTSASAARDSARESESEDATESSGTAAGEQSEQPNRARRQITTLSDLPASFGNNQLAASVPEHIQRELEDVLDHFKNLPIRYAFAYGSGVFSQRGYSKDERPMLDFLFAVSHPSHFHDMNLAENPSHYSPLMRTLGSGAISYMQEKGLGAGVWYNVDCEVRGKRIKYGTISIDTLTRDMLDWTTLYIPGRTQKPVRILRDDARVRLANQVNLASALRTALLLLPERFDERQLFETICGLSYRGDFRMHVGENPRKVKNIVDAQLGGFRKLYGGLLKSFAKSVHVIGETPLADDTIAARMAGVERVRHFRQEMDTRERADKAARLPVGLRTKIEAEYRRRWNLGRALSAGGASDHSLGPEHDAAKEELWARIVEDESFIEVIDRGISQIVARPTFNQALKGILSTGVVKSVRYVAPKLRKKWAKPTTPTEVSARAPESQPNAKGEKA